MFFFFLEEGQEGEEEKELYFFFFKNSIFHPANDIWFCVASPRFAGMGNLLKVLTREIENYPHFFLDFESKFQKLKDNDENLFAFFIVY